MLRQAQVQLLRVSDRIFMDIFMSNMSPICVAADRLQAMEDR